MQQRHAHDIPRIEQEDPLRPAWEHHATAEHVGDAKPTRRRGGSEERYGEQGRQALLEFRRTYNSTWLIERLRFRPPDAVR